MIKRFAVYALLLFALNISSLHAIVNVYLEPITNNYFSNLKLFLMKGTKERQLLEILPYSQSPLVLVKSFAHFPQGDCTCYSFSFKRPVFSSRNEVGPSEVYELSALPFEIHKIGKDGIIFSFYKTGGLYRMVSYSLVVKEQDFHENSICDLYLKVRVSDPPENDVAIISFLRSH